MPEPERPRKGWRGDIQGLRAVAVSLVVVYHAAPTRLSGGYVGVDVFFVISGFLITQLLVAELEAHGRIDLGAFYGRRIRRLLPASLLVIVATVVAARLVLPPLDMPSVTRDAEASALYVSNIRSAVNATNYLGDDTPSPLLHYWTLGLEEHFYLVWPALLFLAGLGARRRGPRLAVAMAVVAALTFGLSVWLTDASQPYAFFLLPARAWEFAIGGLIALAVSRLRTAPALPAAALTWAGLAAILWAATQFDQITPYPGSAALVPVLGAAAIIAGGVSRPRFGARRLLELWPFGAVGAVSYSFYLWHWPLILLPEMAWGPLTKPEKAGLILLALGLACLTYGLVERPGQRWQLLQSRKMTTYWTAALAVAAVLALAVAAGIMPRLDAGRAVAATGPLGATPRFVPSNLAPTLRSSYDDVPAVYHDGCALGLGPRRSNLEACYSGDLRSRKTIVLFGDSHAAQWEPAVSAIALAHHWRVLTLTKQSCPSVDVSVFTYLLVRIYRECDEWRQSSLAAIRALRPFAVVLSNSNDYTAPGVSIADLQPSWRAGLTRTLALLPPGSRKIVIADTARFDFVPAACLSEHIHDVEACGRPAAQALNEPHLALERAVARAHGAAFVDLDPLICPHERCEPIHGNLLVYRDSNHLTASFVQALTGAVGARLLPALRPRAEPARTARRPRARGR